MAVDGFEISKIAAGYVVSYLSDQSQARTLAAQVAKQLNENNAAILAGVANLLKAAFSEVKLNQCNNMAKTIATFMDEYNVNPSDPSKLIAVEQKAGELLDVLDDPDIAVAGISNWMITANIRILALQEKAKTYAAELTNAKNRAKDYSGYVESMIPTVESSIQARFGPVGDYGYHLPGTILIGPTVDCVGWGYAIDGSFCEAGFPNKAVAGAKRDERIKALIDPPKSKMTETIEKWRQFANG